MLSESELRVQVVQHGAAIRAAEAAVIDACAGQLEKLADGVSGGSQSAAAPRLLPATEPRGRAAWPAALQEAVATVLDQPDPSPPEGVCRADWDRVLEARRAEQATGSAPSPPAKLRRLGPQVEPEQIVVAVDEVLVRRPEKRLFWEHRVARVATTAGYRYVTGSGDSFLRTLLVLLALCGGRRWPVTLLSDGAEWLRLWLPELRRQLGNVTWILDWYHLRRKVAYRCTEMGRQREERREFTRAALRPLLRGDVIAAVDYLRTLAGNTRNEKARAELRDYLLERREAIPEYQKRRQRRQYIGSGWAEKGNDLLVARRQKRKGMHWSWPMSSGLVALRTLILNDEWDAYWDGTWQPFGLSPSACAR